MQARIYQPAKTAMSSGVARTRKWVLEYTQSASVRKDRLTGWVGGGDTSAQVRLRFDTLEAAQAYAVRKGLAARVVRPSKRKHQAKAYADNFRHDRTEQWSH